MSVAAEELGMYVQIDERGDDGGVDNTAKVESVKGSLLFLGEGSLSRRFLGVELSASNSSRFACGK